MTFKAVINTCYGGFSLSDDAFKRWAELEGVELLMSDNAGFKYLYQKMPDGDHLTSRNIVRQNQNLVKVVEEMGEEANGDYASLSIVELPDDVKDNWFVDEYDGKETVREIHRTWR